MAAQILIVGSKRSDISSAPFGNLRLRKMLAHAPPENILLYLILQLLKFAIFLQSLLQFRAFAF